MFSQILVLYFYLQVNHYQLFHLIKIKAKLMLTRFFNLFLESEFMFAYTT